MDGRCYPTSEHAFQAHKFLPHAPELCYARPSNLVFGSSVVSSQTGVQQGDPLGPLLFPLVLQPLLFNLAGRTGDIKLDLVFLISMMFAWRAQPLPFPAPFKSSRLLPHGLGFASAQESHVLRASVSSHLLILVAGMQSSADVSAFPIYFELNSECNFDYAILKYLKVQHH